MTHNPFSYLEPVNPICAPRAVTLFSGVGGSSLALRNLGYQVICHDFMPEAIQSLKANGFIAREGDVRDIDWSAPQYAGTEIVEGGPPCQPFSQSHDGDGRYDPRDMIPEFIRAVAEISPKLFVMEEVQTLTWKRHADYLAMVVDHLETLGYRVEQRVLNAADYGIPQARKRLFLVGVREDIAQYQEEVWGPDVVARPVWPEKHDEITTMAEALGWSLGVCWRRNRAVPDPRAHIDGNWHDPRVQWPLHRPAPTVVGSFRPEVAAAPGYRKAGDPPRQATPGSVVTTLEERLRLQDFPRGWKVCGSTQKRDLQVGNSVPVGLMQQIIAANITIA